MVGITNTTGTFYTSSSLLASRTSATSTQSTTTSSSGTQGTGDQKDLWRARLFNPESDPLSIMKDMAKSLPLDDYQKRKINSGIETLEKLMGGDEEVAEANANDMVRSARIQAYKERLGQIKEMMKVMTELLSRADADSAKFLASQASTLAREVAKIVKDLKDLGEVGFDPGLRMETSTQTVQVEKTKEAEAASESTAQTTETEADAAQPTAETAEQTAAETAKSAETAPQRVERFNKDAAEIAAQAYEKYGPLAGKAPSTPTDDSSSNTSTSTTSDTAEASQAQTTSRVAQFANEAAQIAAKAYGRASGNTVRETTELQFSDSKLIFDQNGNDRDEAVKKYMQEIQNYMEIISFSAELKASQAGDKEGANDLREDREEVKELFNDIRDELDKPANGIDSGALSSA